MPSPLRGAMGLALNLRWPNWTVPIIFQGALLREATFSYNRHGRTVF